MKRRELLRMLKDHGWEFHTTPGKHDAVTNPNFPGVKIPIPRHNEIPKWTAEEILKEAGIK